MTQVTEDFNVRNLSGIPKLTLNPLLLHTRYHFPRISGLLDMETCQVSGFLVVWLTETDSAGF